MYNLIHINLFILIRFINVSGNPFFGALPKTSHQRSHHTKSTCCEKAIITQRTPRETNNAPCHFLTLLLLGRECFKGTPRIRREALRSCHRCRRQKRVLAPDPSEASTRLYILKTTSLEKTIMKVTIRISNH